jgi:hypothetical protein
MYGGCTVWGRLGAAVTAALLLGLVGGCAADTGASPAGQPAGSPAAAKAQPAKAQPGQPWRDDTKPAAAAGKFSGRTCDVPISFDLAASWSPKAVKLDGGELDALAKQGGATMKCEIDAKPAGNIGFLRVWTPDQRGATPQQVLKAFLAGEKRLSEQQYRDTSAGGLTAAEVTYLRYSPITEESKRERVLAVQAPTGIALLVLSGFNNQEYEEMLPAYLLAQQSLTPNP